MEYREAVIQDAKALLAFKKQVYDESIFLAKSSDEYQSSIEDEANKIKDMRETENALTWLAVEEGEVIGCINIRPYALKRQKHTASMGVAVKKAYWSKGIGRQLISKAIDFFKASNLHRLELTVVKDNEHAIGLYKSLGFEEEGIMKEVSEVNGHYQDLVAMAMIKSI